MDEVNLLDGIQIRRNHFPHHCDNVAGSKLRLNNGSFGASPKCVNEKQRELRQRWLSDPDEFYLNVLAPSMKTAVSRISTRVGATDEDTVALVDNLTVASAMVARWASRSLAVPRGSQVAASVHVVLVLTSSFTYSSVRGAMESIASLNPAKGNIAIELIDVQLPFPCSLPALQLGAPP